MVPIESSLETLRKWFFSDDQDADLPRPDGLFEGEDGLAAWLEWGEFLKREYAIEQFAFIEWGE
jgi:hypothetical protein